MKRISLAAFIGAAGLLVIMLGLSRGGSPLAGSATLTGTSATAGHGPGIVTSAHSSARAAQPPPRRVGRVPVLPRGARRVGALDAATKIKVDVMLAPSSAAALQDYAANVSSPGNALYHHYLTVSQFAAMFGPTASAVSTVEASLRAAGLTPGPLSANHLILPVTATAKQFAGAFSTGFDKYQLSGGRTAFANTTAPLLPGPAAQYVSGVIGLDTVSASPPIAPPRPVQRLATSASPRPQVVTGGPQPCTDIAGPAANAGVYTADQIASAYNFPGLYQAQDLGAGITIAVVEFEPNLASDIATYQACYGTSTTVHYIQVDGGAGPPGPGSGEAAADIEDIIGLAPKATIDVYQAPLTANNTLVSDTELPDLYNAIFDSGAQVMSTSWGFCETGASSLVSEDNLLFDQAKAMGVSVFAASGDDGSTDCGGALSVDDPGSQPNVTSVGGTSLTSVSPLVQTTWNVPVIRLDGGGASGGGISSFNQMPTYQSSAPAALNVINSNSSGSPCGASSGSYCREVPDVSASADLTHGYVIFWNPGAVNGVPVNGWIVAGGTSLAAPTWAAFTALTDASSTCAGKAIGFANPLLYRAAAANYAANFTDITTGGNDYTPDGYTGGLYPAGTGYDMATGLGSPNGATLAHALCTGGGALNTVTVTSLVNQVTTVGASFNLLVTATDSGGASLTFSVAGLPPGLSISPSGLISGSPTAAGTYPVTVTATDATGASGSAAFTISVNQAAQTISFTAPATGTAGQTATLSATGGGSNSPVVFTVDASSGSGVCSVSGSTLSYLAVGSCVIDANQAGNAGYSAAPTVTKTITVGLGSQTISFTAPATGTVGGTATLTATGGGSNNPVVFTVDASSGSGVCSVSGTTVTYLAAGSCVIDANQAGNASYSPAPPVIQTITVNPAVQSQTITFTAPASGTVGQTATLTATGGGSNNPVVFTVDASSGSGVCGVSGATVSYLAAGSCVIDANQAGNASFSPAPTVTQTITVTAAGSGSPASQTITFTAPASGTVGQTATLTATGGGSNNPVVFTVDASSGSGVCGVSGATVSYLAAGSCVIDANQAGNASYSPAPPVIQTITVNPAVQSQTITFTAPAAGTVGQTATLTATGGGSNNPVVFTVDASSGSGVCGVSGATVSYLAAGSCVIDANQAAGAGYSAAPTVTETITVGQGSQTISFTAPATGSVGGSATLTATGGGSNNPVVFTVDSTSGSGVCSVSGSTVSYLAAGSCVIDANQAGNANYTAAPQVTQTITVNQGPAFVTDSPPLTAVAGQPYDYTFTASGTPAPTYALASGAPSWLSIDASTGEVTGTPPSGTTSFSYAVTATDSAGTSTAGPFTVTVTTASSSSRADISAALSCPADMTVGDTGTCTLTVANAGPGTASMVEAGVRLPSALSEVSCTSSCAVHANVFTWSLTGLASGDSAQFSVTVKASATGRVRVLAVATSQNCDPDPWNNFSVKQVTIERAQGGEPPRPGRHPGHGDRDRDRPTGRRGR